jgi:flavin reductase (DIM6/NTAB) family NADH-FMN oxidoreductase RutF
MPIDQRELRDAFGRFATGVTVVTVNHAGEPAGLTANSFSSVSLDPPLVLWNLALSADCFEQFEAADHFAINILNRDQDSISTRFATKDVDKWAGTPYRTGVTGAPVIDDAIAVFECKVYARHPGGDHVIYVGEVIEVHVNNDAPPLGFHRGRYSDITQIS